MVKLLKLWSKIHYFLSLVLNPGGFAPIFLLLLLVIGIAVGTYLVQNRTNLNPFAASDLPEVCDPTKPLVDNLCTMKNVSESEYNPTKLALGKYYSTIKPVAANLCQGNLNCGQNTQCYEGFSSQTQKKTYDCNVPINSLPITYFEHEYISPLDYYDPKITVVDKSNCSNLCGIDQKCIVRFSGKKETSVSTDSASYYRYSCFQTDKIFTIQYDRLNSNIAFGNVVTSDPNKLDRSPDGCDVSSEADKCPFHISWDSKSSENVKLVFYRLLVNDYGIYQSVGRSAKGKEDFNLPVGDYTLFLRKLDGTDIAVTKFGVRVDADPITDPTPTPSSSASPSAPLPSSSASSTPTTSASPSSNNKSQVKDKVPVIEGDFPTKEKGDFVPRSDKQAVLDKFLKGEVSGTVECRKTNAQSNEGNTTGDTKSGDSSLWVVPDTPTADIPAKGVYIIDCSKSAIGSYKGTVTCGKRPSGSKSFTYGCIDKSLKSSSSTSDKSGDSKSSSSKNGSTSSSTSRSSSSSSNNSSVQASSSPTLTEKQLADCGFSTTDSGIPLFSIQVGGKSSEVDAKTCQQLIDVQMKAFDERVKKAQQEADEAKARGDTEKAAQLQSKVDAANKKVADCEGKSSTEFVNCAKEAQKVVQDAATAAQSQAVQNALKKLQEILDKKRPGGCVKADLGITPFLEAQRLKRRGVNDEARRVLLCQGSSKNDLKWRVLVGGSSGSQFADADGTDNGNDAERIFGLYGTNPNATDVTPTFPYTVTGKNGFTFYDPNSTDGVQKTLGQYIEAAKAGKTTLRSAPVAGDDGVNAPTSKGAKSGNNSGSSTSSSSRNSSESKSSGGSSTTKKVVSVTGNKKNLVTYSDGSTCKLADSCGNASGQGGRGDCCIGFSCKESDGGKKCVQD